MNHFKKMFNKNATVEKVEFWLSFVLLLLKLGQSISHLLTKKHVTHYTPPTKGR